MTTSTVQSPPIETVQVGSRILCVSAGTVVELSDDKQAAGVEWDDANLPGADVGGLRAQFWDQKYQVQWKTSFSQVSVAQLHSMRAPQRTFQEALLDRYCSSAPEPVVHVSASKTIQFVGFQALEKKISQVDSLPCIDLSMYTLKSSQLPDYQPFSKLRELRLNALTLDGLEDLLALLKTMPVLNKLVCTNAHFRRSTPVQLNPRYTPFDWADPAVPPPWECRSVLQCPSLRILALNQGHLEVKDLEIIFTLFPHLESLDLTQTWVLSEQLGRFQTQAQLPPELRTIDRVQLDPSLRAPLSLALTSLMLQENTIETWADAVLVPLAYFPNLKVLNVDDNPLGKSKLGTTTALDRFMGHHLEELSVQACDIQDWACLVDLAGFCPKLKSFQWQNNPFYNEEPDPNEFWSTQMVKRQLVICLFPQLEELNGSEITLQERKHAELYFINLAKRKLPVIQTIDPANGHFDRLISIHGVSGDPQEAPTTQTVEQEKRMVDVTLVLNAVSSQSTTSHVKVKVPAWFTVNAIKMLCQKHFKLPLAQITLKSTKVDHKHVQVDLADDACALHVYGIESSVDLLVGKRD